MESEERIVEVGEEKLAVEHREYFFISDGLRVGLVIQCSTWAHSIAVKHLHGMEKSGVRLPVGPPKNVRPRPDIF